MGGIVSKSQFKGHPSKKVRPYLKNNQSKNKKGQGRDSNGRALA
jgi:hypothetical protein